MALDRQSIERKDFPIGQRGYDPDAVDAHLSALADEVDDLKRDARRRGDAIASSASEQVRSIVDAAERSASEIQRQAERDARDTRAEAEREARASAEHAQEEARAHVGKVADAATAALERLERMEHELQGLIDEMRAGRDRFGADIDQLRDELAGVVESVAPRPRFEPAPAAAPVEPAPYAPPAEPYGGAAPTYAPPEPAGQGQEPPMYMPPEPGAPAPGAGATGEEPEAELDGGDSAGYDASAAQRIAAGYGDTALYGSGDAASQPPAAMPEHAYDPYAAQPAQEGDDTEGARLIALNMALNGTPRDETERYLSENFQLADTRGLLDEVYASVEG
ncbi:MAG: DivIVA domain-containing protein [Solirubrobacteraceae bacterium]